MVHILPCGALQRHRSCDTSPYISPEAFKLLYKAGLVRHQDPWKNIDDLEIAAAEYIDWFNHRRLHGEICMIPPVELEDAYLHNHPC